MGYFSENYDHIRYPISGEDKLGLRKSQLGAIHAIAAHFTLNSEAAIIVMPTGSGKTAVLMMVPYLERATRVLIVSPSRLVRSQITEQFGKLELLKNIGVIKKDTNHPRIKEVTKMLTEAQQWEDLRSADVVVGTPNCISPAYTNIPNPPDDLFDLLLIDEAHHSPAQTWNGIIDAFPDAKRVLFTATPFRRDKQEIKGKIIYSYPIREAYNEGIFGNIEYVPVIPGLEQNNDIVICREAERIFREDREAGYDHSIMVRTDTRKRARELNQVYSEHSSLDLRVIHSGHSFRHIKSSINKLKAGELDGIICVNMLGEGFDYPNLKIAAIHAPHKSLEVTLQFIGRFARTATSGSNLGTAKFLAIPAEIEIESERLYQEEKLWQEIIANLSQTRIDKEQYIRETIEQFRQPEIKTPQTEEISLYALHPYSHVKIYRVFSDVDITQHVDFPITYEIVYHQFSPELSVAIFITCETRSPKWTELRDFHGAEYDLFVIFYHSASSLLFINSSKRSDSLYESIVKQFSPAGHRILPLSKINKVLLGLRNSSFFNIGMKNRVLNSSTESYRIITGSRAQEAIRSTDGQLYHRGHIFGKAEEQGEKITIGYSSASKVWSNRYDRIPELIAWCSTLATKFESEADVNTASGLDFLSVGEEIDKIPEQVICVDWNELAYRQPLLVEFNDSNGRRGSCDLLDLQLDVDREVSNSENVRIVISGPWFELAIEFSLTSDVYFRTVQDDPSSVCLRKGYDTISLIDYLNANPLDIYLADMSRINGSEIYRFKTDEFVPLDQSHVQVIDWIGASVDITREFGEANDEDNTISIHDFLMQHIASQRPSILFYDHRRGEIADFVSITEREDEISISLFHCKGSATVVPATRLEDVYEVSSQVIKSTYWLNRPNELFERIRQRLRTGSRLIVGNTNDLSNVFHRINEKYSCYEIFIVQPGLSKSKLSEEAMRVLAAADDYATRANSKGLVVIASE